MLSKARGDIHDDNFVLYVNNQLRYHFKMSSDEIEKMNDDEWATHYAILKNIREQEKLVKPFRF